MQCNAMQKVHGLCYSSIHNVRSFAKCNAKCYLFNQNGNEVVLVCNVILQCTTLDRLCNATTHNTISLMNMGMVKFLVCNVMQCNAKMLCHYSLIKEQYSKVLPGNELLLVCNAMQEVHSLYVILQCTTLDR